MTALNLPDGTHLAYIVSHEAYYYRVTRSQGERPSITVMASAKGSGGGVAWEFTVEENNFGRPRALRTDVFNDAWPAFVDIAPFFTALAAGEVSTLADLRNLLDRLGALDETQRGDPDSGAA